MSKTSKVISFIIMVMLVMTMSVVAVSADAVCDAPAGTTVTYTVDVTAARLFEDVQAVVNYDATALELVRIESDDPDVEQWEVEGPVRCPNLDGVIFNAGTEGVVKFNAAKVAGFNFKEGATLVTLEFVVKTEGSTIGLVIDEMTIKGGEESYFTAGAASVTEGITVTETIDYEVVTTVTEPITTEPITTEPITTEPITTEPGTTAGTVPAPSTGDATGTEEVPTTGKADVPPTGAATYIYVAMAMMAMAACAVVVLRKKANG